MCTWAGCAKVWPSVHRCRVGGDACFRSMRNGGRRWAEQGLLEFWNGRKELVPRPLTVFSCVRFEPSHNRRSCWRSRFSGRRILHVDLPLWWPHRKFFSASQGECEGALFCPGQFPDCLRMLPSDPDRARQRWIAAAFGAFGLWMEVDGHVALRGRGMPPPLGQECYLSYIRTVDFQDNYTQML